MARKKLIKGMTIVLSSSPPTCDPCILGKQMRSPVPKKQKQTRAHMRLQKVYIDLCGPMPAMSRSGHHYSMNIIDDYFGYVWTLPLKHKSDAASVLRTWHCAVENQSWEKLKTIVTDNGKLISNSMTQWCADHGIEHQCTAPYTSAHNGCIERLHHTILRCSWSMHLDCNAPACLWDEFNATTAYLMNFLASSGIDGQIPYELWFREHACLNLLCEIGCRAFALIQTLNPKIYWRSTPCTLIRYSPHSKAYQLWDNISGHVFDSYHVTFIEKFDSLPAKLLPGTTAIIEPDASPTWDVSGPAPISHTPITPTSISPPTSFMSLGPHVPYTIIDEDPDPPSVTPTVMSTRVRTASG